MTRYATADELQRVLDADDDGEVTVATLDPDRLQDWIDTASEQIDGALATAGYRIAGTPDAQSGVTPAPLLVRRAVIALAGYQAALTYRETIPMDDNHPTYRRSVWASDLLKAWIKGEQIPTGGGSGPGATALEPSPGGPGDLSIGEPINALHGPLFGAELLDPVPPGGWLGFGNLYDPDWYR